VLIFAEQIRSSEQRNFHVVKSQHFVLVNDRRRIVNYAFRQRWHVVKTLTYGRLSSPQKAASTAPSARLSSEHKTSCLTTRSSTSIRPFISLKTNEKWLTYQLPIAGWLFPIILLAEHCTELTGLVHKWQNNFLSNHSHLLCTTTCVGFFPIWPEPDFAGFGMIHPARAGAGFSNWL